VRCPRCQRDSKDGTLFCPGCGAPLALGEEPDVRPLDVSVALDRRHRAPGAGAPTELDRTASDLTRPLPARSPTTPPAPAAAAPPPAAPDNERSHWDLGAALAAPPGPALDRGLRATPPPALRAEAPFTMGDHAGAAVPGPLDDGLPEVEVDALEIHLRRPASWRRAAAWAVDGLPFLALFAWALGRLQGEGILGGLAGLWNALQLASGAAPLALPLLGAVAIAAFVYHFLAHVLAGATLGKWLLRLRVVGPDGRRPTPGRSAGRAALAAVSVAGLGLGLLLALFTRSGRAFHDLLASTWVVEAP
jgi:resuscitation-promoting factor RpfA